ncbi:DUF551 domain-containing protein [Enterobacter hormaechei]
MSELTKEWLLKTIAELEEECDAVAGVVNEDAAMALAAMKLALTSLEAKPVSVNDDMAYAFHHAISDSSLGSDEVEEIKAGLRAAFANVTAPPAPVAVPDEMKRAQGMESYWETQCRGITDQCEELQSRIAELGSHKAALLKFIRDSCYVFDGDDEDISDAYVDAITSGMMPKLEAVSVCNPPLFWVRVKSDGGYDGPIHDSKMEDVRKKSGEWLPLTLACVDASRQPSEVSCRAAMLQGAEPVQGWIPCSERMPDEYDYDIWIYSPGKGVYHGVAYAGGGEFMDDECQFKIDDATHWMPMIMPAAPRQEDK